MSGMLLIRFFWFVGVVVWGAIFTFVDIAVHRSPLPAGTADWLLWAYDNAAVVLTGVAFMALALWNARLDSVFGTPFVAFKTPFWSRVVFCAALVIGVGVGSAAVRYAVGQPAFPPLSMSYLFLPFAAVALAYVTAPRSIQFEKQHG